MQHFSHKHSLILNEIYDANEGDMCYVCDEQIVSCKLFVYSCMRSSITTSTGDVDHECLKFLLHKSCAELPLTIQDPECPEEFLYLDDMVPYYTTCDICDMQVIRLGYGESNKYICVKCAMFYLQSLEDRKFDHPAHSQHPLTLVQHLASFKCYACKVADNINDLSFMCTKCPFWMHKNCADAPTSFQFQFHSQHPLILSFSLPRVYRKFEQHCKLCNKKLSRLDWIYYCPNCRFFAHFRCARSNPMLSSSEDEMDDSDLVHLPAADESSMNLLFEQFVKALSSLNQNDERYIYHLVYKRYTKYSATKGIKHWSHDEHDLQLMTTNELSDGKDDDEQTLLLCDGCVKPIRSDDGVFYGCVGCKYFLHKVCAELPRDIKHHLWPGSTLSAHNNEPHQYFFCLCCSNWRNGIYFIDADELKYDIGCVSLPKIIKHEAHRHQLNQIQTWGTCKACGFHKRFVHRCEICDFNICASCIMEPRRHKHPWDPHPLRLIYDPGMVSDHEAEYNCEYCSKDIDTNRWFYHCSDCDLSFHLDYCFKRPCNYFNRRSKIKVGATDIKIDKLHPHSLTLILNKKVRSCKICHRTQLGEDVLECAPCKAIFCLRCQRESRDERESKPGSKILYLNLSIASE